jgi:hypothetical protein
VLESLTGSPSRPLGSKRNFKPCGQIPDALLRVIPPGQALGENLGDPENNTSNHQHFNMQGHIFPKEGLVEAVHRLKVFCLLLTIPRD